MSFIYPYYNQRVEHIDQCVIYVSRSEDKISPNDFKILVNAYKKYSASLTKDTFCELDNTPKHVLNKKDHSFLDLNFKILLVIKFIINYFFLFINLFQKNKQSNTIVRSWVDVSYDLYKNDIDDKTLFLVYPFSLNLSRQIAFIKFLKNNNISYHFCGINYSFTHLFRCLINKKDLFYSKYEEKGMLNHYDYLSRKYNCKKILTTDEFEVSSFVLHDKNRENGICVLNKSHGIGLYSPFVSYDKFYIYSTSQLKYYSKYSKIKFELYPQIEPPNQIIYNIVFISQVLNRKDKFLLKKESLVISEILKIRGINLIYKSHPNSKYNFETSRNISQFKDEHYNNSIFISLYSTTYYSFLKYGQTYLINTPGLDPSIWFGQEARIVNYRDIENHFKKIINDSSQKN